MCVCVFVLSTKGRGLICHGAVYYFARHVLVHVWLPVAENPKKNESSYSEATFPPPVNVLTV